MFSDKLLTVKAKSILHDKANTLLAKTGGKINVIEYERNETRYILRIFRQKIRSRVILTMTHNDKRISQFKEEIKKGLSKAELSQKYTHLKTFLGTPAHNFRYFKNEAIERASVLQNVVLKATALEAIELMDDPSRFASVQYEELERVYNKALTKNHNNSSSDVIIGKLLSFHELKSANKDDKFVSDMFSFYLSLCTKLEGHNTTRCEEYLKEEER